MQPQYFMLFLKDLKHRVYGLQDELVCLYSESACSGKPAGTVYQGVLWRTNPSEPVQIYHLNTTPDGTRAGAFLVERCILTG